MAQRRVVELIDDLGGSKASQSLNFSLDGIDFEIDLSDANADEFRTIMSRYTAKARREGGRKRPASETGLMAPPPRTSGPGLPARG